MANSSFEESLGAWQSSPGGISLNVPYAPGNGLTFPATVEQVLNLDEAASYSITYSYYVEPGATWQNMTIALGTTSSEIPISPIGAGQIVTGELAATTYTHDRDDGLFTLRITALAGSADQTILKFVCVSDSSALPITPGDGCIVLDPTFNIASNDSPWYDIGSSPDVVFSPGMAELPDGADIQQTILLNPKADASQQDYDLAITYRRKGVTAASESIGIDWSFGAQSGSFPATDNQMWRSEIDTISIVTLPSTASLEFDAMGSDGDQVAQISKICLTPHNGGTAPGYLPAPIFQPGCRYCIYSPTGDVATDLSEFTQWLGCQFWQLWECQMKILMRYIWQTLVSILTLFGFFRLWLGAIIQGGISWGNGNLLVFSRWLGGEIDNLGITFQNSLTTLRSFTLITSGGAGFWDAIIAIANAIRSIVGDLIAGIGTPIIGLLQQIIDGLFGLIGAVMGILGTVLTIVFNWLGVQAAILLALLRNVISALYMAFNTAAVAIPPGAPDCSTPGSVLYYPCLGFYVLDNTIFSGPVVYIIPVFMGIMAWRVLLWAVHRIKATFEG